MPKNIVILCDGTSNEISEDRTNILRLFGTLAKNDTQIVYYDPGVGTFGPANMPSYYFRRLMEVWGSLTGWGIDQNVLQAYRFLVEHYDDGKRENGDDVEPDKIYLFGFSRGAYTVRVLAGFIHATGLIDAVNLNLLNYMYRAYKNIGKRNKKHALTYGEDAKRMDAFAEVRLFERILRPKHPSIELLGLFDTVSSIFESDQRYWVRMRPHAFTMRNRSVAHVRHALAIDEKRSLFQPKLWAKGQDYWPKFHVRSSAVKQDIKEVWFSGVHGDIGGGYPERKSELAKIPLDWMINETKSLGLQYKTVTVNKIVLGAHQDSRYVRPNMFASINQSMNIGWALLEFLPRKASALVRSRRRTMFGWYIPFFGRRVIPSGALIHNSVFKRRGTENDFKQPNIPKHFTQV